MPLRDWDSILSFISSETNTASERRFAIADLMPDIIDDGFNQTNAHALFRTYGLGINDRDFRNIYRQFSAKTETYELWDSLNKSEFIPDNLVTIGDIKPKAEYRYVANVSYIDSESDRFALGEFGYISANRLTIEEAEEALRVTLAERYQVEPDNLRDIRITREVYSPKALF